MRFKHFILPLTIVAVGATAQAEPLKVKPGLWETTSTTEKKGSRQPTNLDSLTPEQRSKVEKELAGRAKKETHTAKSCLKEAQIRSGEAFTGGGHHGACTRKLESQTASDQVARVDCRGANPMSGKVEMHAVDPEHMTGHVEMTYGAKDKLQLLTRSEITARWLGNDCAKLAAAAPTNPRGPQH